LLQIIHDSQTILRAAWFELLLIEFLHQRLTTHAGRNAFSKSSKPFHRSYAPNAYPGRRQRPSERDDRPPTQITGHPDDSSVIHDTLPRAPTHQTRSIEDSLNALDFSTQSIKASVNAHISSRILSLPSDVPPSDVQKTTQPTQTAPQPSETPYPNLQSLYSHRRNLEKNSRSGSHVIQSYDPLTILRNPPTPQELTVPMLLANQTHLGHHTSLWHPGNSRYIFGIRDSIHIISLDETFAHLRRASKVVQEIARRGGIILFIGTRKGQEEIVVNAAKLAQGYHILDRWVPGSLTNGQQILGDCAIKVVDVMDREIPQYTGKLAAGQHPVLKPDLVICLNPLENEVCLHECGLYNVPTIGVVDTDVNPTWVTYPIPANDDSLRSIALIAGCLARAGQEGQRLRMESAKRGIPTYDSQGVVDMLEKMEEVRDMDVSDAVGGASADK